MSGSAHTRTTPMLSPYTAERKQETDETSVVVKPPAVLGIAPPATFAAREAPATGNALLRYAEAAAPTHPADSVRTPRAAGGRGCIICGATARDAAGTVKHEGACPLFMRGPEHGGDPHEWSTLFSI